MAQQTGSVRFVLTASWRFVPKPSRAGVEVGATPAKALLPELGNGNTQMPVSRGVAPLSAIRVRQVSVALVRVPDPRRTWAGFFEYWR